MLRALAVFVAGLAVGIGCGNLDSNDEELDAAFLDAARHADEDGYTMYWVGNGFTAGDLRFVGPSVSEEFGELEGGGVRTSYGASVGRGSVFLDVTMHGPVAWDAAKGRFEGSSSDDVSERRVTVAGERGTLIGASGGARDADGLFLVLPLDETVVVASTHPVGPATPGGPDLNPLVDEDTFLAVLENLRPYEE